MTTAAKKTVRLRFNAEPQHRLDIGGGKFLHGGDEATVSAELAEAYLAADYVDVSIVDGSRAPTWPRSHEEIDALAERFGVELPQPPADGSRNVSVAEKVAALEEAGKTPADAAALTKE